MKGPDVFLFFFELKTYSCDDLQYLQLKNILLQVEKEIDEKMIPFQDVLKKLDDIPGVNKISAEEIIAEATTKMEVFKDERSFAAWAGVAPGNKESAGKKKEQSAGKETLI